MLVPYWPSSKLAQRQRNVALAYSNNHEKKKVSRPARSSSPSFIRSKNIRHSLLEAKGQRIFIKPLRASTVGLASTPVTLYRASHRRDCFLRCQSLCRGDTANQDSNGFVCVQSNVGVPRHRIPGPADRRAKVIIKPRHCLGSPSFMRKPSFLGPSGGGEFFSWPVFVFVSSQFIWTRMLYNNFPDTGGRNAKPSEEFLGFT